ncbi:MAG TPA: Na+/H+ antiporter NhaA [Microvirga sp.]|jgi:NhaA family Na+:H+ antiporter|nr:Na+/H+ antiporter NhaA [Microvirga sp.]
MSTARRTRPLSALRTLLTSEAGGGLVLMGVAALALAVANSPLAGTYFRALERYVLGLSVLHWINDGLMAVFFLLVGLEIKREFLDGQLSTWPRRALPGIAALGGMVVPAAIYVALNWNTPETLRGWAIPSATDIAFALGVLALLGSRVPASLKVFLTALAILDDLGAVLIIAIFYTADVSALMLGGAALGIAVLAGLNRAGVTRLAPYLLIGVAVWYFVLKSGVHATIAGVLVALTIPLHATPGRPESAQSPLHRLEHALHPWSAYAIVPIFGFANAGVSFEGLSPAVLLQPVPLGIALGLFVGKQIGVYLFSELAIRLRLADVPAGATRMQCYGVALLCGIGFTMSLFIGNLAFPDSPELIDATKIGVLAGSVLSALVGFALLRVAPKEVPPRASRPMAEG